MTLTVVDVNVFYRVRGTCVVLDMAYHSTVNTTFIMVNYDAFWNLKFFIDNRIYN